MPENSIHPVGPGAEDAGSLARRAHPPSLPDCLQRATAASIMRAMAFSSPTRYPSLALPAWGTLGIRPSSLEQAATTDAVHWLACLEPRASRAVIYRNVVSSWLARRHKGRRRKPVGASSLTMAARGCPHDVPRCVLPRASACPGTGLDCPSLGVRSSIKISSDYISPSLDPLLLRTCSPPMSREFGYSFCAQGLRLPSDTLEEDLGLLRPGTRAKFALLALRHVRQCIEMYACMCVCAWGAI